MTDRFYIQRLKTMIKTYGKDLCYHCPLQKGFGDRGEFINEACSTVGGVYVKVDGCGVCRRLMNIPTVSDCPCSYFKRTKQVPLEKAKKVIERWEKENGEVKI